MGFIDLALMLRLEAFHLSLLDFASQVPVTNSEKILAGPYFYSSLTCFMAVRSLGFVYLRHK